MRRVRMGIHPAIKHRRGVLPNPAFDHRFPTRVLADEIREAAITGVLVQSDIMDHACDSDEGTTVGALV